MKFHVLKIYSGNEQTHKLTHDQKKIYEVFNSLSYRKVYRSYSKYISSFDKGTRLLRPSGKLVQLVAKVLQESPDGLLQVPQIYAALQ